MSDNTVDSYEEDQDSEPTMTAPSEGRPDGTVADPGSESHAGPHASEADDQLGSEEPTE
ncbi:MAG TPA: hypothetical protein VFP89_09040 [Propionibacteriaceae bacterium]|jgi:hypothetical protein|nr:hypothetical protein [Propionibacteriaceae bacterium]